MKEYSSIPVRHIEDARYLHDCGLSVYNYRDQLVDVHDEHKELAVKVMQWKKDSDARWNRRR